MITTSEEIWPLAIPCWCFTVVKVLVSSASPIQFRRINCKKFEVNMIWREVNSSSAFIVPALCRPDQKSVEPAELWTSYDACALLFCSILSLGNNMYFEGTSFLHRPSPQSVRRLRATRRKPKWPLISQSYALQF